MRFSVWQGFLVLACLWLAGCTSNVPWEPDQTQAIPHEDVSAKGLTGLRIGVVLPTRGKNAALGKAMLNAAILANYDIHNRDITLIPMDQSSVMQNPAMLTAAHVAVTVGPLTAEATRRLQPFAKRNNIRIFSLSNDSALADEDTVVLGYRVDAEVSWILSYANARGKTHILVLAPKDAYGDAIITAIPADQMRQMQIIRFGNPDELQAGLKTITAAPDAVFVPVSRTNLPPVLAALSAAGLGQDKTQYISTGVWDDPTTRQIAELDHAWYPSADPARVQSFTQHYQMQYGAPPPRLAALSYNAVAMIAILDKQSASDPFNAKVLATPSGFQGVDGLFRILPDGSVKRALAVVEIQNHQPIVIQPPPDSTALSR